MKIRCYNTQINKITLLFLKFRHFFLKQKNTFLFDIGCPEITLLFLEFRAISKE